MSEPPDDSSLDREGIELDLDPETAARLEEQAAAWGLSLEQLAVQMLRREAARGGSIEVRPPPKPPGLNP